MTKKLTQVQKNLRAAARHIEKFGWCRFTLASKRNAETGGLDFDGPVCMLGALRAVTIWPLSKSKRPVSDGCNRFDRARDVLNDFITRNTAAFSVSGYNDEHAKSKRNAVRMLRLAAESPLAKQD